MLKSERAEVLDCTLDPLNTGALATHVVDDAHAGGGGERESS